MSILIVADADVAELGRKLENTLTACRRSRLDSEVVVGCESHDAQTAALVGTYAEQRVRLVIWPKGTRSLVAFTRLTHAAKHDIVVFSGVTSRMAPEALDTLVTPFRDRRVGMTVPKYIPCVDDGSGLRARLEAATHGVTAASYEGLAVRRGLLRRQAHDTVQPGLATALEVFARGLQVVAVPEARVFYKECTSSAAHFSRIAQRTQGHLQTALRQRGNRLAKSNGVLFAILHEGLRFVPALAAWLAASMLLAVCSQVPFALSIFAIGAVSILSASWKGHTVKDPSWFGRLGTWLTTGAAQTYGILCASR